MRTLHRLARLLSCGLILGAAASAWAAPSLGDFAEMERLQATLADVAEEAAPSVVAIRAEKRGRATTTSDAPDSSPPYRQTPSPLRPRETRYPVVGSGMILRSDGVILTNEHVVADAAPEDIVCTLSNGDSYTVRAVTSDRRSDLAVLRIDARDLSEARLGDARQLKKGHFAIVMGNPFGIAAEGKPAMSFGIISELGRPLTRQLSPDDQRYYGNLIETDARINLGNSGGPLLNLRGEVIGITTAVSTRSGGHEGVGYAIPMDQRTRSIVDQLVRGEIVEYGYLGIRLDSPNQTERRRAGSPAGLGALVRQVEDNTPAAKSKLRSGDVIVEFDGSPVQDIDELIRMVGAARVGVPVAVTFYREGIRQTLEVSPARREVTPGVNYLPPLSWRGLKLADLTPELRDRYAIGADTSGVVITEIDQAVVDRVDAPLRDEIQEGVIVSQINGMAVDSLYQLKRTIAEADGPVKVSLVAKSLSVDVMLPPDPVSDE